MSIYIQSYESLNDTPDAFIVNASYPTYQNLTVGGLHKEWAQVTDNRSSIVAGSIKAGGTVPNGHMVSFIARQNIPSVAYASARDGFTCVAGNIFMSKRDRSKWRLENGRLVQAAQGDLSDLLKSRMARVNGTMIFATDTPFNHGISPNLFDYGLFYNTDSRTLDSGWMTTAGRQVSVAPLSNPGTLMHTDKGTVLATLNMRAQNPDVVPVHIQHAMQNVDGMYQKAREQSVLAAAARYGTAEPGNTHVHLRPVRDSNEETNLTSGNFTAEMAKNALNYLAGLYAGSNFFKELEQWVKERRNYANEEVPLTTMRV